LPAVIHDQYCEDKTLATSDDVHEMFYNAMRAAGVGEKTAIVMWVAVYTAGPHWKVVSKDGKETIEVFYRTQFPAWPPEYLADDALKLKDIRKSTELIKQRTGETYVSSDWQRGRTFDDDWTASRFKKVLDEELQKTK
jgi:hypothetical protein